MTPIEKAKPLMQPHQTAILIAGLVSVIAWLIPGLAQALLPLGYLNTHLHELGHAFAGQLTGADVQMIVVHGDGSGATPMLGGSIWLIGPAGYIGAAIMGALIIWFSRTPEGARKTLRVLAVVLAIGMLLWVRGDLVGVLSGVGWITALLIASHYLKGMPLLFTAQFLGLQQCLNSIQAVYTLLHVSAIANVHSDAKIMEKHTAFPDFVWAFGWCAFSLVLVVISLRRAWTLPASQTSGPR